MPNNLKLIEIAQTLTPELSTTKVYPVQLVEMVPEQDAFQGWSVKTVDTVENLLHRTFVKNDSFVLDFGDHQVGYLNLSLMPVGSPPDAPLRLKLTFGEMPCEIGESFDDYQGWLSRSWLQDEIINVDVLPAQIRLPRRYCFRYLKIEVLDTSRKYSIAFPDIHVTAVTSGDASVIKPLPACLAEDLRVMDNIAIKTLQDCMQTVFEDGPKRDRRLWIGDLRLQAQANYLTFQNADLVKRCLYLFGGMTLKNGEVSACVFEKPHPLADDTLLYDYSLFFVATLYDYFEATGDWDTLKDLWQIALDQLKLAADRLDERGIVRDDTTWWCFIDWHDDLNKQASAQAVLIYALKRGERLARKLQQDEVAAWIDVTIKLASAAAVTHLWDAEQKVFISGAERQVSWASQVWMVLAEVLDTASHAELLRSLFRNPPAIGMTTPYMYHHLIEALILSGLKDMALEQMRAYWGEMVKDGADCFWELYNPSDKRLSPYGSNLINSYCHAWSCTPTYFIRKYFLE
ncbi:family 78 glycoside hydrolase catalytic domain [Paenibacillus whitsoniae]|uniref:Sugar hydrolase n=1 Tax=Paenibacillus whitsoniae TaxID=2496558 RepID=A0A430JKV2_9BACL|nr:family 78 glycoside hydrolase catalytic domain [Paenibacillus whitsoniae]RTE11685.1 sugar hydrolase [Paenibacillus whitsoniae]